jgi:hypothetical protein
MIPGLPDAEKKHLGAYLQIAVLGRTPKPEEEEFVKTFKAKGQEFQTHCENFNHQQGVVRDYDLQISEIKHQIKALMAKINTDDEETGEPKREETKKDDDRIGMAKPPLKKNKK